jgi:hypothetical protein
MLRDAFKAMNLAENEVIHDDLLQHDTMLWYAWQSMV